MIYAIARRARRRMLVLLGAYRPAATYQARFVERSGYLCDIKGMKILVVGANTGEECKLFIDQGAAEVHGIDVIEDIGKTFQHPRVTYHRTEIERTDLPGGYFDLVFAVATMEHVQDIKAGFAEMERLATPGGFILSSASPLWQSPYGHHLNCFDGHPWVHLVHDRDGLVAYAHSHGIRGQDGHPIEHDADYIFAPEFFNRRPAREYIDACLELSGVEIRQNDLDMEPESLLHHPLGAQALCLGYHQESLLAVTHTLIARKNR